MDVILIAAVTQDGFIARHPKETITWSQDLNLFKKQYQLAEKGLPNYLENVVDVMVKRH